MFDRYSNQLQAFTLKSGKYKPLKLENQQLWLRGSTIGIGTLGWKLSRHSSQLLAALVLSLSSFELRDSVFNFDTSISSSKSPVN
ncbi:MAG UNVERIFIED_CONTAM: hypothetical protein LVR29_00225 [Microcystis novacekii LVE1205-3]